MFKDVLATWKHAEVPDLIVSPLWVDTAAISFTICLGSPYLMVSLCLFAYVIVKALKLQSCV